ncbi:MAG: hypothetical protein KGL39_00600 [Patescibacteria group bacterium]|nr:hypothetical protein [Patescibacteria group bacterium]
MGNDIQQLRILYTNWKGETGWQLIQPPFHIHFASNDFHTEKQWLLDAFDVERQARRSFTLRGVHRWDPDPHEMKVNPKFTGVLTVRAGNIHDLEHVLLDAESAVADGGRGVLSGHFQTGSWKMDLLEEK